MYNFISKLFSLLHNSIMLQVSKHQSDDKMYVINKYRSI